MNWYKKSQTKTTENIVFDIYSAITNTVGGAWTVLEDKHMMRTYKLQAYRIIHIDGKDVKMLGDYFWVEIKIFIFKALNVLHPWDGTYENAQNWQQGEKSNLRELSKEQGRWLKEEEQNRWKALKEMPPEDASFYDEQHGNKLITFDVLVYGKKPDGKEPPDQVNKIEIHSGYGDIEKIDSSHEELDTPTEIAQYIKNVIDKYYAGDNEDDIEISPQPNEPIEVINYNPLEVTNYSPQLVNV